MQPSYKMILRYGEPSRLDTAEFGTLCKVSNLDGLLDFYLQSSIDPEFPKWDKLYVNNENDAIRISQDLINSTL